MKEDTAEPDRGRSVEGVDVVAIALRVRNLERVVSTIRSLAIGLAFAIGLVLMAGLAWSGAWIWGVGAVAGAGTQAPVRADDVVDGEFNSLRARQLFLVDDAGHVRASLAASRDTNSELQPVRLKLVDVKGQEEVVLSAGGFGGPSIDIVHNHVTKASLGVQGGDPVLQLIDGDGKRAAVLWFMNESPHLILTDEKGKTRAVFGYQDAWLKGTGDLNRRIPSSIAIYDEKGNVVWSATSPK